MDEQLINKIVNLKLGMADNLINLMPEKMSTEIKNLGMVILKSINENVQEPKEQSPLKSKSSDHLSHVPIE